ncbi:DeoR family transcriptional regulator [Loigolactobacillus coryniformis]|uniref:DeoR family transcriptional regulator n=1 Tax=Loigolactobacillus coryniformis TaxID=1610 RepID=UPI001C5F4FC7|nr:DeoR family transcriptional regulator [Loigolactobacillus coryniformis]MBW4806518.1 DeoR/GlpR transcriptional regulator [Loigolactobacillus coryniformis subsp. torquens]
MDNDRQEQILDILKATKYISLEYLINHLHYSDSTIRRDLRKLEKLGLIKYSTGGVTLIKEDLKENPLVLKSDINKEQKKYIADLNYAYLFLNLNENVATPSFYL